MTTKIRITLQPTPNNDPGAGVLTIAKTWEGATENLQLAVQRNDAQYLQDATTNASPWAGSPCYFTLQNIESVDGRLHVLIGANLIDPLVNSARTSPIHQIELKDQNGYSATGSLIIKQAPLPSIAGGSSSRLEQNAVADAPDIAVPAAPPETAKIESENEEQDPAYAAPVTAAASPANPTTATADTVASTPNRGKKNGMILGLIALVILAAAAIGGWLWLKPKASISPAAPAIIQKAEDAVPEDATPSGALTSFAACDISQMGDQSDLEFIQACLNESPDSARVLDIIQQAKNNNHCSIAQRLYANRSQSGDLAIAAAYVKEYDPEYHQPSDCFKEPDEATARYWYETILQEDPNNTEAQTRLTELNK